MTPTKLQLAKAPTPAAADSAVVAPLKKHLHEQPLHHTATLLDPRSKNNAELLAPREKQNIKNKENTTRKNLISSLEQ